MDQQTADHADILLAIPKEYICPTDRWRIPADTHEFSWTVDKWILDDNKCWKIPSLTADI